MKSHIPALSVALLCTVFLIPGSAAPLTGSAAAAHSPAMQAIAIPASAALLVWEAPAAQPVSPMSLLAITPVGLHPNIQKSGSTPLGRRARAAEFDTGRLTRMAELEEPSWLLVLSTCLLASAAALFRRMNA